MFLGGFVILARLRISLLVTWLFVGCGLWVCWCGVCGCGCVGVLCCWFGVGFPVIFFLVVVGII